jgi:hypothetical protein
MISCVIDGIVGKLGAIGMKVGLMLDACIREVEGVQRQRSW